MNYARGLLIARMAAGLSQRRLAKLSGVGASYISHLEAGRRKPSLDFIEKAAEALKTPVPLLLLLATEVADFRGITDKDAIRRLVLEALSNASGPGGEK